MVDCLAADVVVPRLTPVKAPPIASYDWSGFYVGGHVGYSRGYGRDTLLDPGPSTADRSFGSIFGGMQFGYNYMLPSRLLVGVEGDISFPNYLDDGIIASRTTPSSSVTEKLDFVSTVRGRAGYAFDHWLFYATGGLAWSQARFLEQPNLTGSEDKVLRMRAGWAVGAGAELAIAAEQFWDLIFRHPACVRVDDRWRLRFLTDPLSHPRALKSNRKTRCSMGASASRGTKQCLPCLRPILECRRCVVPCPSRPPVGPRQLESGP
jgi:opacity protein-like surface antigen